MHLVTKRPLLPEKIYVFRHGQSIGNEKGNDNQSLRHLPNHQFPLTELGWQQAQQLQAFIQESRLLNEVNEMYVSTFLRAQQTLECVLEGAEVKTPVYQDSRLDEWWKGIFHSLSKEERSLMYPYEDAVLEREGWHHYRPPQGEAGKDVEFRIRSFLRDVEGIPLISSHGRYTAFLERVVCQRQIRLDCSYTYPKNCELWKFTREGNVYRQESLFLPTQ